MLTSLAYYLDVTWRLFIASVPCSQYTCIHAQPQYRLYMCVHTVFYMYGGRFRHDDHLWRHFFVLQKQWVFWSATAWRACMTTCRRRWRSRFTDLRKRARKRSRACWRTRTPPRWTVDATRHSPPCWPTRGARQPSNRRQVALQTLESSFYRTRAVIISYDSLLSVWTLVVNCDCADLWRTCVLRHL